MQPHGTEHSPAETDSEAASVTVTGLPGGRSVIVDLLDYLSMSVVKHHMENQNPGP